MQPGPRAGGCRADSKRGRRDGDPRNTCNEAEALGGFQTVLLVLCLLCLRASEVLPEGGGCSGRREQEECPEAVQRFMKDLETSTVFLNDWKIQGIAHRDCMVGCSSLEMICSCELSTIRPAWLQFIHHAQHHPSKDDGHPANVIMS